MYRVMLWVVLLSAVGWARSPYDFPLAKVTPPDWPDSPSVTQPVEEKKCGPWKCWDYNKPQMSWGQAVRSKRWWGPTLVMDGTHLLSLTATSVGLARGKCVERNLNFGRHPSNWELFSSVLYTDIPVNLFGLACTKLKCPWAFYAGATTYGTQLYARGAYKWIDHCW